MPMNAKHLWQLVLDRAQKKVNQGAFESTFRGSRVISLDGEVLRVRASSLHACTQLEGRFAPLISSAVREIFGPHVRAYFETGREEEPPEEAAPGRAVYEGEVPPQQLSSVASVSNTSRARQQPLPGPVVAPEPEPPQRLSSPATRPLQPTLLEGESAESQVVSLPLDRAAPGEARVVDAEPVVAVPVPRVEGAERPPLRASAAEESRVVAGSLFEGDDQPEHPSPLTDAQRLYSWSLPPGAAGAQPGNGASHPSASGSLAGASSSLPDSNGAAHPRRAAPEEEQASFFSASPEPGPVGEDEARSILPRVVESLPPAPHPVPRVEYLGPRNQASMPFPDDDGMLNPRYTFETFAVGAANNYAYNAAQLVTKGLTQGINPLFLYGGVGLGKTHLLHAIGHVMRARGLKVLYTTSENFTNEIINAIRFHSTTQFRDKYRQLDVLMVDDVQSIAGKEATEEEFFNTFNTLHMANKQIVLSSDRSPAEIPRLHERLRSRMSWGIQPEILKPEYELRVAILRLKAQQAELKLSDAIIELFARPEYESVRELESMVARLQLYARSEKRGITMALALEVFDAWQQGKKKGKFDLAVVLKIVARTFEIQVEDLLSPRRDRRFAWPRQIAMYLLRIKAEMRFERVGEAIGGRDHSTVMHAVDQVTKRLKKDAEFELKLRTLWQEIEDNFPRMG